MAQIEKVLAFLDEVLKGITLNDRDFEHLAQRLRTPDPSLRKVLADLGVSEDEIQKIKKGLSRDELKGFEGLFK